MRVKAIVACGVAASTAVLAAATVVAAPTAARFAIVALPGGAAHTEPSLVVDAQGRAYVSAIAGVTSNTTSGELGTPVWRSQDYRHWTELHTTSLGPSGSPLGGGDSALMLDGQGDVFATDLWLGDDSISISTDHGSTWIGGPVSHRMGDDRTWLAFSGRDDALYQVYDGVDGLYIARSDLSTPLGPDAALTFAFTQRIVAEVPVSSSTIDGVPARQAVAPPGGIAVDQRSGAVYVAYSDQNGVAVASSIDKGLTWSITHVPSTRVSGTYLDDGWNFLPVATDARGGVYVAWAQIQGQNADPNNPRGIALKLASSTDGGAHWRVIRIGTAPTAVLPTLAIRGPGHVSVAWVDTNALGNPNVFAHNTPWALRYAEIALGTSVCQQTYLVDGHVHQGSLFSGPQGGDRGMGDFFQIAALKGNAALVAYTRGEESDDAAVVAALPAHHSRCG